MKMIWNYSDTWARGIFAYKTNQSKLKNSNVIDSFNNALSTFNPFGNSLKLPKKLPSDEFITYKKPISSLLSRFLKNLK
jgi:hypothetical protein